MPLLHKPNYSWLCAQHLQAHMSLHMFAFTHMPAKDIAVKVMDCS